MPNVGATELLLILFVLVLLFGASRLPKLARGVGESVRELRAAANDDETRRDERD